MNTLYFVDSVDAVKAAFGRGYFACPSAYPALGRIRHEGPAYTVKDQGYISLLIDEETALGQLRDGDFVACQVVDDLLQPKALKGLELVAYPCSIISTNYVKKILCKSEDQVSRLEMLASQFEMPACDIVKRIPESSPVQIDRNNNLRGHEISPIKLDCVLALLDVVIGFSAHEKCLDRDLFRSLPGDFIPAICINHEMLSISRGLVGAIHSALLDESKSTYDETYWYGPQRYADSLSMTILTVCLRAICKNRCAHFGNSVNWPIKAGLYPSNDKGESFAVEISARLDELSSRMSKRDRSNVAIFNKIINKMPQIDVRIQYGDVKEDALSSELKPSIRAMCVAVCAVLRWLKEPIKSVQDYIDTYKSYHDRFGTSDYVMGLMIVKSVCGYTDGGDPRVGYKRPVLANILVNEAMDLIGSEAVPPLIPRYGEDGARKSIIDESCLGKWIAYMDVTLQFRGVNAAKMEELVECEVENRYGHVDRIHLRQSGDQRIQDIKKRAVDAVLSRIMHMVNPVAEGLASLLQYLKGDASGEVENQKKTGSKPASRLSGQDTARVGEASEFNLSADPPPPTPTRTSKRPPRSSV